MVPVCGVCGIKLQISSPLTKTLIDNDIVTTSCEHLFHKRCLAIRIREHGYSLQPSACPTCNQVIEGGSLIEIGPAIKQADLKKSISWSLPIQETLVVTEQPNLSRNNSAFSDTSDGVSRNHSICSITRRSYLRKRIMELKELEGGIKTGSQVVCYPDTPEEGIVKWLGKINQIIYIGVEFVNPVGNNFPETSGAPPFACKEGHGRLVLRNDLVLASEFYRERPKKVLSRQLAKQPYSLDSSLSDNESLKPQQYPSTDSLASEFSIKLDDFYDLCCEANGLLEKTKKTFEIVLGQPLPGDSISISVLLERTKSHLNDMDQCSREIEMCRNKSEEFAEYSDVLLPSEERRINRTLEELNNFQTMLRDRLLTRITVLETSLDNCQTIKELLNEKLDWLSGTKSNLRQMDRSLITTESQLTNRIERVESLMRAFKSPDSCDMAEIASRVSEFRKMGGDVRKFDSLMFEFIGMRNQVQEDIQTKLNTLRESSELFRYFTTAVAQFDEWYEEHMLKICEVTAAKGQETDCPADLRKERENKRVEFLEILRTARKLRVSIFDPSVLDDKIQALQTSWRTLIERVYRGRGRKSV